MFHAFDGRGVAAWTPERFVEMALYLRAQGYDFLSLEDACSGMERLAASEKKRIFVTIDDGTEDVVGLKPYLRLLDLPITLCVPSLCREIETSDGCRRPVLERASLKDFILSGRVSVAGHGATHRHLTELSDQDLGRELKETKWFLQDVSPSLGAMTLAYPRGRYDERVMRVASEHGFKFGWTTKPGVWDRTVSPLAIPRYPVLADMSVQDVLFECEGRGDRVRRMVRWFGSGLRSCFFIFFV